MADFTMKGFIADLRNYHTLSPQQQENSSRLIDISKKFHKKAKIPIKDATVESDRTIILESGHQPNFLPYSGIWKKAFCLNWMQNTLNCCENTSVAFFGLADQNISTARILSKNQIPSVNKEGLIKIGFKIKDSDKFKSFCRLEKPPYDLWQNEINTIGQHYCNLSKKVRPDGTFNKDQWDQIRDILSDSYQHADNFAELNGVIFARICNDILGIHLCFFLYSDMHHENFFIEESTRILQNLPAFNHTYNQVIEQKKLDLTLAAPRHLPFWYECDCGVKLEIVLDDSFASLVKCPVCNKEYHLVFGEKFQNLARYYANMDFNAVSRNIAMAQGLGDTLFISGTGGSLQYGQISDKISTDLTFHRPIYFGWRSKDYYLGIAHKAMVHELMKQFLIMPPEFLTTELHEKISNTLQMLSQKIDDAKTRNNQKDLKNWTGMYSNSKNLAMYAKKVFSTTPSFIDILVSQDSESIKHLWDLAIENAEIVQVNGNMQIQKDIRYPANLLSDIQLDYLPVFYENIRKTEV
jgi:hypothetical protein